MSELYSILYTILECWICNNPVAQAIDYVWNIPHSVYWSRNLESHKPKVDDKVEYFQLVDHLNQSDGHLNFNSQPRRHISENLKLLSLG